MNHQQELTNGYSCTNKIKLPNTGTGARVPKKRILERQRSRIKKAFSEGELQHRSHSIEFSVFLNQNAEWELANTAGKARTPKKLILEKQLSKSSIYSNQESIVSRNLLLEKQHSKSSIYSNPDSIASFKETIDYVNGKFCMRKKKKLKNPKIQKENAKGLAGEMIANVLIPPVFSQEEKSTKSSNHSKTSKCSKRGICEEKKEEKLEEKKGDKDLKKDASTRRKRTRKKDKIRRQRSHGNDSVTTVADSAASSNKEGKKEAMKRRAQIRKKKLLEIVDKIIKETKERKNIDVDNIERDYK